MPWIWLNEKHCSQYQKSACSLASMSLDEVKEKFSYCVADFEKSFDFSKKISSVKLFVSADCFFHLYVNGRLCGIGPAASGGDFLCVKKAPKHYLNTYEFKCDEAKLNISAKVRLQPEVLTDYSLGRGGFYLFGRVVFEDGSQTQIETDSSWKADVDAAYNSYQSYDSSQEKSGRSYPPTELEDIWSAQEAPIPMLSLCTVYQKSVKIPHGEKIAFTADFDKIYGVYPVLKSNGKCKVEIKTSETENLGERIEKIVFGQKQNEYMSFRMHSAGRAVITAENTSESDVTLDVSFTASWYPVTAEGLFETSNADLNAVFELCKHTLKICRQTLHLDSTMHQELLACTGDYNIESLMTLYCFGDMRLSEFDLMRTADWLQANNGVMFHTTYSLIWVQMLCEVYMITGNRKLLLYCENALDKLLEKFESYMGENGVVDSPPDFMFVDWTVVDGFSMHHPPKALGQTVLNAFYFKALVDSQKIYLYIEKEEKAARSKEKAEKLKKRFNELFFDSEKMLYFDGLGTPCGGKEPYHPANVNKKYFTKYPNILAALYGLSDEELARDILDRIIFDDAMQDIQPYFMHYLLCAVRKLGMFEKYGMKLLQRWVPLVKECNKGLKEGWIAPEESYGFDHSHAWGGTPAYQMPAAITGMTIEEAGMKTLRFSPNLFGLDYAKAEIPTPYGPIKFKMEKGKAAKITAPDEIKIICDI